MATKTKQPELLTIGELCKKYNINRAVFAGACVASGWKPGRVMSDEEFLAGIERFTRGPASGPRSKESEANE